MAKKFATLAEVIEKHTILVMEGTGSLTEAAMELGIDPATLYRKRRKKGIKYVKKPPESLQTPPPESPSPTPPPAS